ncbi:hypothetical protein [Actinocorallia aurea]
MPQLVRSLTDEELAALGDVDPATVSRSCAAGEHEKCLAEVVDTRPQDQGGTGRVLPCACPVPKCGHKAVRGR